MLIKKNVVFLHGLESNNKGDKVNYLNKIFQNVYAPFLNYKEENFDYQDVLNKVKSFEADLIIGSSMGSYLAYALSNTLKKKCLLFNPAIHSRSIVIEFPFTIDNSVCKKIVLGKFDTVINPQKTIKLLEKYQDNYVIEYYNNGHRVPFDVFKIHIDNFVEQI